MRNLLPCLIMVPALAIVGCKRENMGITLDRAGHATGENQGTEQRITKVAGKGEAYHTLQPGESLSDVSKMYNYELGKLIERNGFTTTPTAGTQVIVPARATGGGAPRR